MKIYHWRIGNKLGRPTGAYGLAIGQTQACDLFRRPGSGLSKPGLAWPIPTPNWSLLNFFIVEDKDQALEVG
ncbi:hypothetical protein MTR_8g020900 [Medicago truncatula]|uniref:Uncharacterized protein n=1 Tax=Medicago truncatula TaxID=3880 RepID=G7L7J1_MEDTR|nr:hypothetical protein MTR_8g020900 [Medicago truncatula]